MLNPSALNWMAKQFEEENNEEMAYRCYLESAMSEKDGKALFNLGKMYLFGDYVVEDYDKAGHYFKLAYETGYSLPGSSYIIIANCKEEERTETWESKMNWYRLAADHGCDHGYECMGFMYMKKGEYLMAIDYFLIPEKKTTTSLYNLGKIYDEGLGVEPDLEKAIEYYKRTVIDCWDVKEYGDELFEKARARLRELGIIIEEPA
ncbi:MAG: sel1 repeat family protein [Lachnospiraceae bacterium]|nr:sel1 repeat family protein [Lachnospiraceae bacterium]